MRIFLRTRFTLSFISVLVLAALAAGTAGATTLMPMSGAELTAAAERIVVGRCTAVTSQWFGRSLVTLVSIAVDESLKGEGGAALTLTVPGGTDLNRRVPITITVPGTPVFAPGDEVLLFLDSVAGYEDSQKADSESGYYRVVGFSQGLFPIVRDAGETLVAQSRGSREGALPLATVKGQIAGYLRAQDARP